MTTSPSDTGPAIQDPPDFSIGDSINRTLAIAPSLASNPGVAVAAAQANIGSTQVETLGAYNRGLQLERFITSQDPQAQQNFYNTLGSDDKTLLSNMGYQTPGAATHHSSIWDDVKHVGGEALHALGAPLRTVQHAYRTVAGSDVGRFAQAGIPGLGIFQAAHDTGGITYDENGDGQLSSVGSASIVHPSSFVRAWRATSHGERAFNQKQLAETRDKYDAKTFETALRFAEGDTIQDIADTDPVKIKDIVDTTNAGAFKQALADINGAKISAGRNLASSLGINPSSTTFKMVSGGADGIFDWYADPTLAGGKLVKIAKVARWGIHSADSTKIERIMSSPAQQRGWGYITDRLNTIKDSQDAVAKGQAMQDITRHFPRVTNLIDPLIADAKASGTAVTLDSVKDYIASGQGLIRLMSGLASREAQLMPGRLSKFGEAKLATSDKLHDVIDFLTDGRKYLPYDKLQGPGASAEQAGATLASDATQAAAAPTGTTAEDLGSAAFDYRKSLSGRLRFAARRLTTRVPVGTQFNANDASSVDMLRKVASTYLPTQRVNQVAAAFAGANIAGKRAIYFGMLQELGHASGITMSSTGSEWWAGFTRDLEHAVRDEQSYSTVPGAFVRTFDDGQRQVGGLAPQMSNTWSMPSFKEMHAHAARIGVADRAFGGLNQSWVDGFMGKWRTGVLLRFGFALRVAGDEVFNGFFRGNGPGLLKARIVKSLVTTPDSPMSPTARVIGRAVQSVSSFAGLPVAKDGADYAAQHVLEMIRGVLTNGAEKVLDPEYLYYIRKSMDSPTAHSRQAGAIEDTWGGRLESNPDTEANDVVNNVKHNEIRYRPDGSYSEASANGLRGAQHWAHGLEHLYQDDVAWHVATHPEQSFEQAWPEMHDIMMSKHYQEVASQAEVANVTKDGRYASRGEATQEEAYKDWAKDIYDTAHAQIRDNHGNLITPLTDYLKENDEPPHFNWLNQLENRPEKVTAPNYVAMPPKGLLQAVLDQGWTHFVARPMNWISRQPIWYHEYVQARKGLQGVEQEMLAKGMSPENVESLIGEGAEVIAHDRTIKFVHNPQARSQFSVITRNIFPFRHAEEGALQRWANAMVHSPEGLRRAQLTYEGLRHSGIVTKDNQGNDYVAVPGTPAMMKLFVHLANILPGVHIADLPIPVKLGFEVRFISPFLTQAASIGTGTNPLESAISMAKPIIPPGGPIVGASMSAINKLFPESRLAQDVQSTFVGPEGKNKPIWEQFAPTSFSRLYGVWGHADDRNSQLVSAQKNAIQYLEAAGLTPDVGATPDEVDAYLNRVKNWARIMLTMRAVFGFASPAAPDMGDLSPKADEAYRLEGVNSVSDEFYKLTSQMPYQDALATFIKLHPDDSPFTVGMSKSISGARLSSTSASLDWMDSHADLLKKYPTVAPFLMPQDPGPFNYDAYKEQLLAGIRQKETVKEHYAALKVRHASDEYFAARDLRDQAIADALAAGKKDDAKNIQANWHTWADEFTGLNPLFAAWLAKGSERMEERKQGIAALQHMVDTGDINRVVDPHTAQGVAAMTDAWAKHVEFQSSIYNRSDKQAVAMRTNEKQQLGDYLRGLVKDNPSLQSIYNQMFAAFTA